MKGLLRIKYNFKISFRESIFIQFIDINLDKYFEVFQKK
jgi:hypothetical protein